MTFGSLFSYANLPAFRLRRRVSFFRCRLECSPFGFSSKLLSSLCRLFSSTWWTFSFGCIWRPMASSISRTCSRTYPPFLGQGWFGAYVRMYPSLSSCQPPFHVGCFSMVSPAHPDSRIGMLRSLQYLSSVVGEIPKSRWTDRTVPPSLYEDSAASKSAWLHLGGLPVGLLANTRIGFIIARTVSQR